VPLIPRATPEDVFRSKCSKELKINQQFSTSKSPAKQRGFLQFCFINIYCVIWQKLAEAETVTGFKRQSNTLITEVDSWQADFVRPNTTPLTSMLRSNGTTMLTYVEPANGRSNMAALLAISSLPTASYIKSKLQINETDLRILC